MEDVPDNVEDFFKELDKREYAPLAAPLGAYQRALEEEGCFSQKQSFKIVKEYAKFLYKMTLEEYIGERDAEIFGGHDDDDVDSDD